MTFEEQIRSFATRARKLQESVSTEEATKTSLIMPFSKFSGMMCLILKNLSPNLRLMWV